MGGMPTRVEGRELAIRTDGLIKRFGRETALDGLDLTVPEGAVYVLVGPNGAGKTTTLRLLLDVISPTAGNVRVLGLDPTREGPAVRARVGWVPERAGAGPGALAVAELLRLQAAYHPGAWDSGYADRLSAALELRLDARYGRLSQGHARRVQLVLALAWKPALLLLDEPTDGLDPVARDLYQSLLSEHLAVHPTTVLVSTHAVHEVETLADHLGVLRAGRLVAQLSRDDLQRRLRRYRGTVPDDWRAPAALNGSLVRQRRSGREGQWTVWGDEPAVRQELTRGGINLTEVATLTLEQAALELLGADRPERSPAADDDTMLVNGGMA